MNEVVTSEKDIILKFQVKNYHMQQASLTETYFTLASRGIAIAIARQWILLINYKRMVIVEVFIEPEIYTPHVHFYTAHIRIPEFFDQHLKPLTL